MYFSDLKQLQGLLPESVIRRLRQKKKEKDLGTLEPLGPDAPAN